MDDMIDFDRRASVKRSCTSAANRIVFDGDLSAHPLEQIQYGIVFIHAFWAGQSHLALKKMGDVLARIDPDRHLDFIVCDIDAIQQLHDWQNRFYAGGSTGGNGDVLWIANGIVRARHNASRQCDFDATTGSLLLEWQAAH